MHATHENVASEIAGAFGLAGHVIAFRPHAGGHIHRSFVLSIADQTGLHRYFAQQINTAIFSNPSEVSANIAAVTAHLRRSLVGRGERNLSRRVLNPLRAIDGGWTCCTTDGRSWRLFDYIERATAHGAVRSARDAFEVGAGFGEFQALLADYDGPALVEVLPGFHDTPARLRAFDDAARADRAGRATGVGPELDAVDRQRHLASALIDLAQQGALPTRIVHNDAKISNILFDEATAERLCVVDLDIVMPGLSLFDFGDMVRSSATSGAEDEPDLRRVIFDESLFEAIASGYRSTAGDLLSPAEREHLVTAGLVITFEQALRFLTDYLNGDLYYSVSRDQHNLNRARTQLALLEQMSLRRAKLERIASAS